MGERRTAAVQRATCDFDACRVHCPSARERGFGFQWEEEREEGRGADPSTPQIADLVV